MRGSRNSGSGRRREGPRPHKHFAPGTPGGRSGGRNRRTAAGFSGFGSPKSGRRLPLPKKTGGPMDTKKGAKGYKRPTGSPLIPEEELGTTEDTGLGRSGESCPAHVPNYELLDHTADLGIRVAGGSLEELFENAGMVLFDLLTDLSKVRPVERFELSLKGDDVEDLLVEWLRELLYFFFGKKTVFCGLDVAELSGNSLQAVCWGEPLDPERHVFRTEIKAVTYHGLRVVRAGEGWTAEVIFDI